MVDHGLKTLDGPVELVQSFPSLILHKLLLDRYELSHARPQSEKLTIDFMIDKGRYQRQSAAMDENHGKSKLVIRCGQTPTTASPGVATARVAG